MVQFHARSKTGVLTLTVAVALGLVNAPLVQHDRPSKVAVVEVQFQAAATQIAAFASIHPAAISDAASTSAFVTTPTANQTADPFEGLRNLLYYVLLPVSLVIAPFWYLGAPITYPLWAAANGNVNYGPAAIIGFLGWAIAPFTLASNLLPVPPIAKTAAVTANSRARVAASTSSISVSPHSAASESINANAAVVGQSPTATSARSAVTPLSIDETPATETQPALSLAHSASVRRTSSTIPRATSADRLARDSERSLAKSTASRTDSSDRLR